MIPLGASLLVIDPPALTGSDIFLRLLSVFLLIAINAFFVAAEFSIVSVRRSRINQLASAGDVQAQSVQYLQRSIERLLSTTQLGITLSSLALGWIGENAMAVIITHWLLLLPLPPQVAPVISHSLSIPIAFLLIAYLQIVLGELCPKSLALIYPEELSRFLGKPSQAIARIFKPFIWILNQSTQLLLRLIGIRNSGEGLYNRLTPEELQLIINTSSESSGLEEEARELISNALEFAEISVREMMVPRIDIVAISKDATFQELLQEVSSSGHSRYPVIADSLDDVHGIIYFKELATPLVEGVLQMDSPIQPWIRPAQFVPENLPVNELLPMLQRTGQALAIVIDEFGGTAGLVTIRDLAAEIIGETHEPEDEEEPAIQILNDHTFVVQAQVYLEEVNDFLNLDLPLSEDYQTLGGFVIYEMQKIPTVGETFQFGGYELTIASAEGPRLHQVRIQQLEPKLPKLLPENGAIDSNEHLMNN
jgi:CBS domain containing-hemolysin-like protein